MGRELFDLKSKSWKGDQKGNALWNLLMENIQLIGYKFGKF